MTSSPATPAPVIALPPQSHWVGVDIGPSVIRAAVYDSSFQVLGKIKLSTKVERGAAAVISRIARSIRYAADECDLRPGQIRAACIGVPGVTETATGQVVAAPSLQWQNCPIRAELEQQLAMPVFVENIYNLGTFGIFSVELPNRPRKFAALFPGARIGGGLIADGNLQDPVALLARRGTVAPGAENIFDTMPGDQFQNFRGKDFKKALRKGNKVVEQFVRDLAARTGEVAAGIIQRFQPEIIAIGGGLIEEMKQELMEIIQCTAQRLAAPAGGERIQFVASALGDYAPLAGAAAWAARRVGC